MRPSRHSPPSFPLFDSSQTRFLDSDQSSHRRSLQTVGDIKRFHSAKAFACATGLTPSDQSTSGKTIHGSISREGSPHLRWALTQAAMGCLRSRSGAGLAAGNWIRAKEKRMGIKAKARTAGGRKLAEAIWRLFSYGRVLRPRSPLRGQEEARLRTQGRPPQQGDQAQRTPDRGCQSARGVSGGQANFLCLQAQGACR